MESIPLFWLAAGGLLVTTLVLLLTGRKSKTDSRMAQLSGAPEPSVKSPVKSESNFSAALRKHVAKEDKRQALRSRLIQAGLYSKDSGFWLNVVRIVSLGIPVLVGWGIAAAIGVPWTWPVLIGAMVGFIGMLAPSFWLDARKRVRQKRLRRSIPDALDVLSICLEGGMSLPGSLSRVSVELATAHPELAMELAIVDRETRMGRGVGESIRSLAERFDLEELRSMSTVVIQAERYGSSLADAMNVFAESMREKRTLAAETKAQQAVIKIIFPTLLCIFPALFVVIMGPAGIKIYETLIANAR